MNDKMQEEFEAWIAERIANNGASHWLKRKPSEDLIDNGGPYQMIWVEAAWQGWQASRAALSIELPESYPRHRDSYIDVMDAELVVEAIEEAGVMVRT